MAYPLNNSILTGKASPTDGKTYVGGAGDVYTSKDLIPAEYRYPFMKVVESITGQEYYWNATSELWIKSSLGVRMLVFAGSTWLNETQLSTITTTGVSLKFVAVPFGRAVKFLWNFGTNSLTTSSLNDPIVDNVSWTTDGTKVVTLVVYDDLGNSVSKTFTVTVGTVPIQVEPIYFGFSHNNETANVNFNEDIFNGFASQLVLDPSITDATILSLDFGPLFAPDFNLFPYVAFPDSNLLLPAYNSYKDQDNPSPAYAPINEKFSGFSGTVNSSSYTVYKWIGTPFISGEETLYTGVSSGNVLLFTQSE